MQTEMAVASGKVVEQDQYRGAPTEETEGECHSSRKMLRHGGTISPFVEPR